MKRAKQKYFQISASESFLVRTVCKKCKGHPLYYFYSRNPILWYDPRRVIAAFEYVKKYNKRLALDDFSFGLDDFRYASKMNLFNHQVNYKGYRPKLHRTRGQNPILDVVEYLTCECGQTAWAYSGMGIMQRHDINHKKAPMFVKKKFM